MARFFSRTPVSCCFSDTDPAVECNPTPLPVTSHHRRAPAADAGGSVWPKYQMSAAKKTYSKDLVPNFIGLDKSSALALAQERNLDVEVIGFGIVKKQSISAGSSLADTHVIRLQFEEPVYAE